MADWDLDKEEQEQWDEYVAHFRAETLQAMDGSAFVMQFAPDGAAFDVKFATELGASIMLDKPLLMVVMPGTKLSGKLRLIADEIVEADVDVEQGRRLIKEAVERMQAKL